MHNLTYPGRFHLDPEKEFEHLYVCDDGPDIKYVGCADLAIMVHQQPKPPAIHICAQAKSPSDSHLALEEIIRSMVIIQAKRHRLENSYSAIWGVLSTGVQYAFIHLSENRVCCWSSWLTVSEDLGIIYANLLLIIRETYALVAPSDSEKKKDRKRKRSKSMVSS
ncbi:hypothetical protein BO71DRAFT_398555 [Aspergillus ellipticus CBS 707.79]|uniref:Uncharacterized protein n=1 Tax=Aspergillus ellipticus CBS 707.79 TaxID=1448320 RepID=A0A319E2Q9_9EURO|nr:hypothetical protein BO71DRAFT_398555 [Aspergillus ellipticus CBS 707.79]